jgi:hypothetical protein
MPRLTWSFRPYEVVIRRMLLRVEVGCGCEGLGLAGAGSQSLYEAVLAVRCAEGVGYRRRRRGCKLTACLDC